MGPSAVYIAHTHSDWFDRLSRYASPLESGGLHLDEVNFWSPTAKRSMKNFVSGEPVFFRLGAPIRAIAGYGFYADVHRVDVHLAWDLFGVKNGAVSKSDLARMLGRRTLAELAEPVTCTILRDAVFWPERWWIPWGADRGYAQTTQRGRTDADSANVRVLLDAMARDHVAVPPDLAPEFEPLDVDDRRVVDTAQAAREGQGTFRLRLLKAYGGRCAVTGEHTEPVLQAAHIQRYLGPASNHVANGLVLTQEFHTLFDRGFATVVPPAGTRRSYNLRLSPEIRERWHNGHRYYTYADRALQVPAEPHLRPSPRALEWHREHIFERW